MIIRSKPALKNYRASYSSDCVSLSISLIENLLEYVRNNGLANSDVHVLTQTMLELYATTPLTLDDFYDITGESIPIPTLNAEETCNFQIAISLLWYLIATDSTRINTHVLRLGNLMRPYYSKEQISTFTSALTDLLNKTTSDPTATANSLSSMNEYWPNDVVLAYFTNLLKESNNLDAIEPITLNFASVFSNGIIAQFPDYF